MRAFAPGSVTAVFAPTESGDDSRGASVATADGVIADVRPAEEPVVTVDGEPTDFEPVELAVQALDVPAGVDLTAEIPIGRGFGASGAATLATVLAANEEFGLGRSREELVEVARRAEVEAGTGLGDVYIQSRGGLLIGTSEDPRRLKPEATIEYVSFGPISTEETLADEDLMARIERACAESFDALPADPSLAALTRVAWDFAEAVDLPTPRVRETVAEVEAAGGAASMAMVGETVFAVGVDGVLPNRTEVSSDGARVLGEAEE